MGSPLKDTPARGIIDAILAVRPLNVRPYFMHFVLDARLAKPGYSTGMAPTSSEHTGWSTRILRRCAKWEIKATFSHGWISRRRSSKMS